MLQQASLCLLPNVCPVGGVHLQRARELNAYTVKFLIKNHEFLLGNDYCHHKSNVDAAHNETNKHSPLETRGWRPTHDVAA